jgi:hypothetical protein
MGECNKLMLKYLIFISGIYGMAWTITQSKLLAKPIKVISSFSSFLEEMLECIICTSFWLSIPFCYLYYFDKFWFVKILICFSQVSFSWILASLLGDLNE